MTHDSRTVGWVGVGAMGLPICHNLMQGGWAVIAHDVSPERMALARAAGAETADSLAELLARVRTVCSMVFDDKALLGIVQAALPDLRKGMFFVDLSTVSPEASAKAAQLLHAAGVRYVRAPVSGSVSLAQAGTLTVLGSGLQEDFEACLPVFQKMSTSQRYVGSGEAARVIKLLINMMVVNSTALIGEAIALGETSGVDRTTIIDAINASIVGSRHYQSRADSMKTRTYTAAGPIRMAAKDLDLALAVARAQSLGLPMTAFVRQYLSEVVHEGRDDLEVSVLAEFPRPAKAPDMETPSTAPQGAERAVLAADDARYRAMLAADARALDALLSADLVYTHSNGTSDNKQQYLAAVRARVFDYRRCERETARFQSYGDVALLHGTVRLEAVVAGQLKRLHNQYLTVWVHADHGQRWQLRAWASTPIPPAP